MVDHCLLQMARDQAEAGGKVWFVLGVVFLQHLVCLGLKHRPAFVKSFQGTTVLYGSGRGWLLRVPTALEDALGESHRHAMVPVIVLIRSVIDAELWLLFCVATCALVMQSFQVRLVFIPFSSSPSLSESPVLIPPHPLSRHHPQVWNS
jgi:hypothetical protein